VSSIAIPQTDIKFLPAAWLLLAAAVVLLLSSLLTQAQISTADDKTIIVDDAADMEVLSYGKTVIVKQRAKGVLTFGADIIVEGSVDGDVAAIGGSIIQKEKAYIGGDVMILGGRYKPESANPLRAEGKETLMYAGYEEELRNLAQDPTQLFAPSMTLSFLAQRLLAVLFWFVVTLALTTLAPGAISRAIARFKLSAAKVVGIGFAAFLLTTVAVIVSLSILPSYLSAIFGLMGMVLLMLAYVFGRVALHVSIGKLAAKYVAPGHQGSDVLAILLGVVLWTVFLSIPYVWPFALVALFAAGVGLVLTARSANGWRSP